MKTITKAQIKNDATWVDDHILCCEAEVEFSGGTTETLDLIWFGWEGIAALRYANSSKQAMADFRRTLKAYID